MKYVICIEELKHIISYAKNMTIIGIFILFFAGLPAFVFNKTIQEYQMIELIPMPDLVNLFFRFFAFNFLVPCALFIIFSISMDTFVSDKKEKSLESVLATPITLNDLWIGKTSALFIICYTTTIISTLAFAVVLFKVYSFWPKDIASWVFIFTLLPLLIFFLIALSGIGQLTSKQFVGITTGVFFIGFGVMFTSTLLMERLIKVSPIIMLGYCALLTTAVGIITLIVGKKYFSKERVVLS